MTIKEIKLKSEPLIGDILKEYCENVTEIPIEKAKAYFEEWGGKVPGKLIRQCIFAGIYWALAHPEDIEEVSE